MLLFFPSTIPELFPSVKKKKLRYSRIVTAESKVCFEMGVL